MERTQGMKRTTKFPRFMIAAEQSGSGKTMLTCALLSLLKKRGLAVHAFKCGPDYIDPMFHRQVLEVPSYNLDSFFSDENTLRSLIGRHAVGDGGSAGTGKVADAGDKIAVLEGVMGYYDGLGGTSWRASSYDIARITDTPVLLIIDASGRSLSVLATIKGFLSYRPDSHICGVILNRISASMYSVLAKQIENELGITPVGYIPKLDTVFESRHLGLVMPKEIPEFQKKIAQLAVQIAQGLDLDSILSIAQKAAPLSWTQTPEPVIQKADGSAPKIAVAMDEAFCFYYQDNLELLERMGAKLNYFSPLHDRRLPEEIDGLYLGGGYPELHAKELSENTDMLASVREAITGGLPCIAECGGYLYLKETLCNPAGNAWPMVGVLPGNSAGTGRLGRFGYGIMTAKRAGALGPAGSEFRVHEFHHWDSAENGDAFLFEKPVGGRKWDCGYTNESMYAGFPHLYFTADGIAPFLQKAAEWSVLGAKTGPEE